MINKTLLFVSTIVLAASPLITANSWAGSHDPKTVEAEEECIPQKVYSEMSAEDKEAKSADVCEGDEGEDTSKDSDSATKAEEGSAPKAAKEEAKEPETDESKMNCIPEETFRALSVEDKEKKIDERCEGSE